MAIVVQYDEPGFEGRILETTGGIVCVQASEAKTDRVIQARIRQLARGLGIDCRTCHGCPIGQAD